MLATERVPSTADIQSQVRAQARARGVRWTPQRDQIVATFVTCGAHVTVEDLTKMVHRLDSGISPATIYRTINLLHELGIAVKRDFGGSSATYECVLGKPHHHHLINLRSGEVIEFVSEELERIKQEVAARYGLRLVRHTVELFAVPEEEN